MRAALLAVVVVLAACGRDPAPPPPPAPTVDTAPARRAFYYWRTRFALSATETHALAALHVGTIYLRVFDVDWDEEAGPQVIGPVTADAPLPAGVAIVPVVYLRNQVFSALAEDGVAPLAARVWREVDDRAHALGFTARELQLDCDWTDSTQAGFFGFVTALRAAAPAGLVLSATIRLHQVKYRERTGVPPVDRGMLMFYNMGKVSADPDARAIFDERAAQRYLARLVDYPLPLDGALPIWSWTIHLRDGQVEGLLQSTDPDQLPGLDFVRAAGADRFEVTRTTFLHGTLLRAGDLLKIEVTGPDETQAAAAMLAAHLAVATTPRTIALFDLSERNLTRHGVTDLERVFQTAR